MNDAMKLAVAREIVADLDRLAREITELQADAVECHFHRAGLRLGRAADILCMVGPSLRRTATMLENKEKRP